MTETSSPEYPPHYLESNWKAQWSLPDRIVYLNHGSFGPSPNTVRHSHENWSRQLEQQPCDFLLRRLPAHLDHALSRLADFLETSPDNLTFSDNATTAMNAVAQSTPLQPGDEVYSGQVVGQNARHEDLVINVCKAKNSTGHRATPKAVAVSLSTPRIFSLDDAIEYLSFDELLEVTPTSLRIRKKDLNHDRRRKKRKKEKLSI